MEILPGFSPEIRKVCKLKKASYGLTQPRAWFDSCPKAMITSGNRPSNEDHTRFIEHQDRKITNLFVYVDYIIITRYKISILKKNLAREFEMKELCSSKIFSMHQSSKVRGRYAVYQILRHLQSAPGKGILFTRHGDLELEAYTMQTGRAL